MPIGDSGVLSPRYRGLLLAAWLLALSLVAGGLNAQWDFQRIAARAEQLYGPLGAGKPRIDAWQRLLDEQQGAPEADKLKAVNRFFNLQLRFRDDQEIWGVADYWATPVEALMRGAADCEDYAIAKYFSLRELGVPSEKLRITYVKAVRLNQAHMVLTYYPTPTSVPLVLDNLIDAIEPATERRDLVPVYAFNAEGLWVPGPAGGKQVGDSKRLSRWQDLLKKMRAEGFP
ncbi:cysteine protease LapG [Phytopseudomonas punonensis]|uniref:Predicted transglutaminase-like cysteine proteinase n=1 Tax=Phytopseudomonas punonensis TaxID=1220495 RepID=A0A1M6WR32_9GAMM|nr:Predicted transglutaminase-like cysteine proteinase [Pseudomonas punonensis]